MKSDLEWRPISGYLGLYEVSRYGEVRNAKTLNHLAVATKAGYLQVGLFKDSKQKWKLVHRLVAEAFLPGKTDKPEVNHIDGDKRNNSAENLEWCSRNQNLRHAYLTGLREEDTSARKIRCVSQTGEVIYFSSIYKAARALGISQGNICMVCKGQRPLASGYKFQYA